MGNTRKNHSDSTIDTALKGVLDIVNRKEYLAGEDGWIETLVLYIDTTGYQRYVHRVSGKFARDEYAINSYDFTDLCEVEQELLHSRRTPLRTTEHYDPAVRKHLSLFADAAAAYKEKHGRHSIFIFAENSGVFIRLNSGIVIPEQRMTHELIHDLSDAQ